MSASIRFSFNSENPKFSNEVKASWTKPCPHADEERAYQTSARRHWSTKLRSVHVPMSCWSAVRSSPKRKCSPPDMALLPELIDSCACSIDIHGGKPQYRMPLVSEKIANSDSASDSRSGRNCIRSVLRTNLSKADMRHRHSSSC